MPARASGAARPRLLLITRKRLTQNARIAKQATSLAGAGYDVKVVGIRPRGEPDREQRSGYSVARLPADPRSAGLPPPLRRLAFPLTLLQYYRLVGRLVARELGPPAIIHCNDLDTLPVGARLASRHGVPLVYDIADLYADQQHVPRAVRWWLERAEGHLIDRADRVMAVNEEIAATTERRHGRGVDEVILNCPPYERPSEGPGVLTARAEFGVPSDRPLAIYSGVLAPNRGLHALITAVESHDGMHLVVLGEGELRAELERFVADRRLGSRVHFRDFLAQDQIVSYLASADVGVIPYERIGLNHYLTSPGKLFHYVMAGIPVACSDFPFLRRVVVGHGIGATFDPSDPIEIAAALRSVISEPDPDQLRERLAGAARRYCWEHEERALLELYASLPDAGLPEVGRRPADHGIGRYSTPST